MTTTTVIEAVVTEYLLYVRLLYVYHLRFLQPPGKMGFIISVLQMWARRP